VQQLEQGAGEEVDEPDCRIEKTQQWGEYITEQQGQSVGMSGTDDFRGDFGKNQDRKGDGQRAGPEGPFTFAEQFDGDDADQGRCRGVDQVVAEQDDAEHLVRLGEEIERLARPGVAGLGHVAQAEAIAGHHGRLAEREEG